MELKKKKKKNTITGVTSRPRESQDRLQRTPSSPWFSLSSGKRSFERLVLKRDHGNEEKNTFRLVNEAINKHRL